MTTNNNIITKDGLFYSNFDRFELPSYLISSSKNYSENLIFLRNKYGIKIGQAQPDNTGHIIENTIGVYIVDYNSYLSDIKNQSSKKSR